MTRTDNDTWDLATSVGATATMVAAGRARATRAALIDDRFAEPLVRAVGVDFFTRWAAGELDSADVDDPGAPWGMQRMTDMLAARTRYIDAFFAEARHGAASARWSSWPPASTHAGTGCPGRRGRRCSRSTSRKSSNSRPPRSARSAHSPPPRSGPSPIDLRHDWPSALRQAGFDTGRPAAWAAEGLLGFLPADAQDRLLDNITALSADGSRLVAEVFLNSGGQPGGSERRHPEVAGATVSTSSWTTSASPATATTSATYLERAWLARGSHTAESVVGRQRVYRCSPATPKRPFGQELLLHRGVAASR